MNFAEAKQACQKGKSPAKLGNADPSRGVKPNASKADGHHFKSYREVDDVQNRVAK